ncbi:DUF4158 domain-containing protein [Herpetosiphon llansteffanensis]|uniref:DUF4158 domain-containing protein n=1 Tax=Herpetosiphon llansteffanensis TaxID=2094568 RepID=UPI000D7C0DA1|nr:DUF4158 domain-containing protein [Herpetosiphon llansteffanensis]
MPTAFLTEEQQAAYGDYTGDPDPTQLAKFFHLDEVDLQRVRRHNGSHHRLGFALQLGTVRFLGTFLANPIAVPPIVIDFMARQLAITTERVNIFETGDDQEFRFSRAGSSACAATLSGGLIHAAVGTGGGVGGPCTKRSG